MPHDSRPAPRRHLLLVGDDPDWCAAAAEAAQVLGAGFDKLPDIDSAIRHLLQPERLCSHLLAASPLTAQAIEALAGMADEVTRHPTPLLLLGVEPPPGIDVVTVSRPEPQRLIDAIQNLAPPVPAPPEARLTSGEVRDGLNAGWLRLRYQPVVDAVTLRPVSVETLARLHHPALGILHPQNFVPEAIACGQERVFTGIMAARAMLELRGLPLEGLRFGINVPVPVFWLEQAVERALHLASVIGIDPGRIAIEVLETDEAPALGRLEAAVRRWRDAGFGVYADDAGPALRHWRALAALPFTGLKLDRSLAQESGFALAAEIAEEGHRRGLRLVAEGIETEAALRHARSVGIHFAQGFLISRPLPGLALPLWITDWTNRIAAEATTVGTAP